MENVIATTIRTVSNTLGDYVAPAVWKAANNRSVQYIKSECGLLAKVCGISLVAGFVITAAIDALCSNERTFKVREDVKNAATFFVAIACISSPLVLVAMKEYSNALARETFIASCVMTSFLLGKKAKEYYNNRYHQIPEEIDFSALFLTDTDLKQMCESGRFKKVKRLNLSNNPLITGQGLQWIGKQGFESLESLNVSGNKSLFSGIPWWKEGFHNLKAINLLGTDVTDGLLERMINETGWFQKLEKLDVNFTTPICNIELVRFSPNPPKSTQSRDQLLSNFNWIVEELDLSEAHLTDADIKQMCESGRFKNLKRLNLSNNPQITGQGLQWIGKQGFESLERLHVSGSKLLFSGIDWWKEGFVNLTAIALADTDITGQILERMINEAQWFLTLEGLDVSCNQKLVHFPSNIKKLTNLRAHYLSETQLFSTRSAYFHGEGLFCRYCDNMVNTCEIIVLARAGKVYGSSQHLNFLTHPTRSPFRHLDLREFCQKFNIPYSEDAE